MRPVFHAIRWPARTTLVAVMLIAAAIGYTRETAVAPGRQGPSGPLLNVRIVVDPGHGGVDGGCHRGEIMEKDLNLKVGLALAERLRQDGALVRLTRTTDEAMVPWGTPGGSRHRRDLAARVQVARDHKAQLYVSLHANTGPSRLGGALTFYRKNDAESKRLAGLVQARLGQLVPGNQNGILPASFYVLNSLDVPAVLVEMGFLTNERDREYLITPGAPAALADAIAEGIRAYYRGDQVSAPTLSPYPVWDGIDPDTACQAEDLELKSAGRGNYGEVWARR